MNIALLLAVMVLPLDAECRPFDPADGRPVMARGAYTAWALPEGWLVTDTRAGVECGVALVMEATDAQD